MKAAVVADKQQLADMEFKIAFATHNDREDYKRSKNLLPCNLTCKSASKEQK